MAKILIVDDDPAVLKWLAETLEEAGHQVSKASDGRKARAQAADLDLVITDLAMPGEEGIETIRALRREHPRMKIIAMSGIFPDLLPDAAIFGACATFTKPASAEMVLRSVSDALQLQPLQ
jgi:DNA-binding NtrC family response regulator